MKSILASILGVLIATLPCGPAFAWSHANYAGGSTSHSYGSGSTTRTDAWGGSETHTYGQGTTATGAYGDSASTRRDRIRPTSPASTAARRRTPTARARSAQNVYGAAPITRRARARPASTRRVRRQRDALRRLRHHGDYSVRRRRLPPAVLRRDLPGVSPAHDRERLRRQLRRLRRLEHRRRCRCGCGGRRGRGAAAANANNAAAQSNAYAQGYAAGAASYAMGAHLHDAARGLRDARTSAAQTYYLCGNTWFSRTTARTASTTAWCRRRSCVTRFCGAAGTAVADAAASRVDPRARHRPH